MLAQKFNIQLRGIYYNNKNKNKETPGRKSYYKRGHQLPQVSYSDNTFQLSIKKPF